MYRNYTIGQICLPIDVAISLPEDDFVHAIVQFVSYIPDEIFDSYYSSNG